MSTSREIHDQQTGIWNSAAPGWKKWDAFLSARFEPVSEALIQAVRLGEGLEVLELACGTGEPGIPAAKRVGRGRVIGTDLADDMMAVAMEKARAQGVSNYSTLNASALSLPLPDGHFDAVLCRWGVMFFPDPPACLKETLRVMKPGAHASFATWNVGEKNPHLSLALGSAVNLLGLRPASPDSPGPLRYADPNKLVVEMKEAGFQDVQVQETAGVVDFDSPDHFWQYSIDIIGAFRNAVQGADAAKRAAVKADVLLKAGALLQDGRVHTTYSSWVISGRKGR